MESEEVMIVLAIIFIAIVYSEEVTDFISTNLLGSPLDSSDERENAKKPVDPSQIIVEKDTYRFCSWNIKDFGPSKVNDPYVLSQIVNTALDCDVLVIQELSDVTFKTLPELCKRLPDYECETSMRKGTTSQKEQYAVLYNHVTLNRTIENIEYSKYERPPTIFEFIVHDEAILVGTIHTKPTMAEEEIGYFEEYMNSRTGNRIAIGDFNMDCSYYEEPTHHFAGWAPMVYDFEDTTVAVTNCAYDRGFLSPSLQDNFADDGIYSNIEKEVSDHYLIWVDLTF